MKNSLINIQIEFPALPVSHRKFLKNVAVKTLEMLTPGKEESLTILICDDKYIQILNKTYRGIDKPTDVLSFPDGSILPGTGILYLGDIAISYPTALMQASNFSYPVEHELSLLVVHGILHLLGYDHSTSAEKRTMWDLQEKVMLSLGFQKIMSTVDHHL